MIGSIFTLVAAVSLLAAQSTEAATALGTPNLILEPKNGRSHSESPSLANNTLQLWCQIKRDPTDEFKMNITNATWFHYPNENTHKTLAPVFTDGEQKITEQGTKAVLDLGHARVDYAKKYRCELESGAEKAEGVIQVHMRPVIHTARSVRLDLDNEEDLFDVTAGAKSVVEGDEARIECPAIGNPTPKYRWERDGEPLGPEPSEGISFEKDRKVLVIKEAQFTHRAVYKCIATNSFETDGVPQNYQTSLSTSMKIKSKLAWLWPLLVILAIAILLAIIIGACEFRRKRREQAALPVEPEDED